MDVEFTDRYEALGIRPPSQLRCCRGQCEATGWVPVFMAAGMTDDADCRPAESEDDPQLVALWQAAEAENPADDGWHFVRCPGCHGTGRIGGFWTPVLRLPSILARKARFARYHLFSTSSWRKDVPHWRWFNIRIVLRILLTTW